MRIISTALTLGFAILGPAALAQGPDLPRFGPRLDPTKIVGRDARIAALIQSLDQIDRRRSRPMPMSWADHAESPAVKALVDEGIDAIGALTDCFEHDPRMTRIVNRDHRHESRFIRVGTVSDAAYAAIVRILKTDDFGPQSRNFRGSGDSPVRRSALAAEIRAFRKR